MILQEMNMNGHWKKLPTAAILVPAGEADTTIQALAIQPLTAISVARLASASMSVLGVHFISNAES